MLKFLFEFKCIIVLLLAESSLVSFKVFARDTAVSRTFVASKIVPDVVPKAPTEKITVKYCTGAVVLLGNELSPSLLQIEPKVKYEARPHRFYTLALVDPDVPFPSLPLLGQFKHWLVGNIPGDRVEEGETLAAYVGATPPPLSSPHRYVFLVFEQPGKLIFSDSLLNITNTVDRTNFSIEDFARKYNLGDPIAGNFFLSKFDLKLPILKCGDKLL